MLRYPFLWLLAVVTPASAAPELPLTNPEAAYAQCLLMADQDPAGAFERGSQWRDLGGGEQAQHCVARALLNLGEYVEAANRLELLATEVRQPPVVRAALLGEAADGWLLAGVAQRADAALTTALEFNPTDPDLFLKRAQALALAQNFWAVIDDLNRVVDLRPTDVDALAFRASAYRYVGADGLALDDANRALELNPVHAAALLERGNLKRLSGDDAGARRDWLTLLTAQAVGPIADAARANIERLDGPISRPR